MARIRTVKPELFRHKELFDLEKETGLPIRLAWIGLFTIADREGRFTWKPESHKFDVLPYDNVCFEKVLNELWRGGFLVKYKSDRKIFGWIPSFLEHQVINNREQASKFPCPEKESEIIDYDYFAVAVTRHGNCSDATRGEGKGTGREKEEEGKGVLTARSDDHASTGELIPIKAEIPKKKKEKKEPTLTSQVIKQIYSDSFKTKYGSSPVWGAKENTLANTLVTITGHANALKLAEYYPNYIDPWHVKQRHPFGLLVSQVHKVLTDMQNIKHVVDARLHEKNFDEKIEEFEHKSKMEILRQKEEIENIAYEWAKKEQPSLKDYNFMCDEFLKSKDISPSLPFHELKNILIERTRKEITA